MTFSWRFSFGPLFRPFATVEREVLPAWDHSLFLNKDHLALSLRLDAELILFVGKDSVRVIAQELKSLRSKEPREARQLITDRICNRMSRDQVRTLSEVLAEPGSVSRCVS